MSSSTSPQYEKVEVGDDSFNPYTLPQTPQSAHVVEHSEDDGDGGLKSPGWRGQPAPSTPSTPAKSTTLSTSALGWVKLAILPAITVAYIAFSYTVQNHIVVVDGNGLANASPDKVASIKSGITSISILLISLGLWPLKGLLDDLKQEEFFRVLSQKPSGVPLAVVNDISSASLIQSALAIVRRNVSPYFVAAFFASIITLIVSTLAPAALSVEYVVLDNDLVAFKVGAVPANSVINTTNPSVNIDLIWGSSLLTVSTQTDEGASLAWAELSLGVNYQFTANDNGNETYLVPFSPKFSTSSRARWLTDVMIVNPDCEWVQTNVTNGITMPFNLSDISLPTITVNVPSLGINVDLPGVGPSFDRTSALNLVAPNKVKNETTGDPADGGRMVWTVEQCQQCSQADILGARVTFDLSDLPTFTVAGLDAQMEVAVLVCTPNLQVESREVRSMGDGTLAVSTNKYRSQGNILPAQAAFLLSNAVTNIPDKAGPDVGPDGLGTEVAATLFFGDQVNAFNKTGDETYTWKPIPLSNITQVYRKLLRSTAKPFLSGALGTAYVPGRTSSEVLIFTASPSYTAVSAAFLILLSCMVVFSHFRKGKGETFTLFSVAASLENSEVVSQFAQFRREQSSVKGQLLEETVHDAWGGRPIVLLKDEEGKMRLDFGADSSNS